MIYERLITRLSLWFRKHAYPNVRFAFTKIE
jgi:hypothetical protein